MVYAFVFTRYEWNAQVRPTSSPAPARVYTWAALVSKSAAAYTADASSPMSLQACQAASSFGGVSAFRFRLHYRTMQLVKAHVLRYRRHMGFDSGTVGVVSLDFSALSPIITLTELISAARGLTGHVKLHLARPIVSPCNTEVTKGIYMGGKRTLSGVAHR